MEIYIYIINNYYINMTYHFNHFYMYNSSGIKYIHICMAISTIYPPEEVLLRCSGWAWTSKLKWFSQHFIPL